MDVVPVSERILQLRDNWFLIYATSTFTAYVSCLNSTSSEFHLKMGVNRVLLSPTCQLKLKDYVLFADTALCVESQIWEFAWNLEDEAFSKSEVDEATYILDQISAEGDNQPSLADVRRHSAQSKSHPKWLNFFILAGFLIFFGLISWLSFFIFTHKWLFFAVQSASSHTVSGIQILIGPYIIMPMILLLPLRLRHSLQLFPLLIRKPSPVVRNHSQSIYLPCSPEQDVSYLVVFKMCNSGHLKCNDGHNDLVLESEIPNTEK